MKKFIISDAMAKAGITKYVTIEKVFEKGEATTLVHRFLIEKLKSDIAVVEVNDPITGKYDEVLILGHRYKITVTEL